MTVHDDELDVGRHARAVWRARWLILGVTLLAGAAGWFVANRTAPRFRATARMMAVTPYGGPVDPTGAEAIAGAIASPDAWARIAAGVPGAPASSSAVNVSAPGAGNAFTVDVTAADPPSAVALANALVDGADERVADARARSQQNLAALGEAEVQTARRAFDEAAKASARFLETAHVRLVDQEPVGDDGKPVTPDVRTALDALRLQEQTASSAYVQATLWQQDMRRQTSARIPGVVVVKKADDAVKTGPWPMRAAAIALLVAAVMMTALVVLMEALRT